MLRLQRLVKVVDGPLPSELGGGFVETRRRVVMEAMIRFWIDIRLIPDAIGLESGFVIGPPAVDVGILLGKVKQQRGLDLWHVRSCRRGAVERHAGRELRQPDRQPIDHTATEAKAHSAKLAGGLWMLQRELGGREEVFGDFRAVQLFLHRQSLFIGFGSVLVNAGIAAQMPSGPKAMKPATARRRTTSSIYGFSPRFS